MWYRNVVGDIVLGDFRLDVECHVPEGTKAVFGANFSHFLCLNVCFLIAASAFLSVGGSTWVPF